MAVTVALKVVSTMAMVVITMSTAGTTLAMRVTTTVSSYYSGGWCLSKLRGC
jgi:hypothetical protein